MLPKKNAAEKKAWKNAAEEYDENCWKLWIDDIENLRLPYGKQWIC